MLYIKYRSEAKKRVLLDSTLYIDLVYRSNSFNERDLKELLKHENIIKCKLLRCTIKAKAVQSDLIISSFIFYICYSLYRYPVISIALSMFALQSICQSFPFAALNT